MVIRSNWSSGHSCSVQKVYIYSSLCSVLCIFEAVDCSENKISLSWKKFAASLCVWKKSISVRTGWTWISTSLMASSCLCLFSLAACSCFILSTRSSSSACCLCRSSLRLSRASRWGDDRPNLSSWMHVWIAAEKQRERRSHTSIHLHSNLTEQ